MWFWLNFWERVARFFGKFKLWIPQRSIKKPVISNWFNGADGRIRTGDLILTNGSGACGPRVGSLPTTIILTAKPSGCYSV